MKEEKFKGVKSFASWRADHRFILKTDGTLYAQGDNQEGQLGLGNFEATTKFTKVLLNERVAEVVTGSHFSMIKLEDGTIWVTGKNDKTQLGLKDNLNRNLFTRIEFLLPLVKNKAFSSCLSCGLEARFRTVFSNQYYCKKSCFI
jgi:alpha-tubulin suppressor-like RCC1 family protein